ncbi:MAG: efflux RND transporter periplasmic adaptor subunit [Phycisphaerae bacterium]|jgi:RND family efflux transporter MFP subunit
MPDVPTPATTPAPPNPNTQPGPRGGWALRLLFRGVLPLAVVAAGTLGAVQLVRTAPQATQRPPQRTARLVEVRPVTRGSAPVTVEAMGTVIAAQEITLQAQVSGEVLEVSKNLVPGGRVAAGEVLVRVDPRDYELVIEEARSQVAQAEYELKLEQGRQDIARREWELLGAGEETSELDRELALRKPHLAKAMAVLAAAQASLSKAELDLSRTTISAPFNGVITDERVDLGAQVTTQTQLATLVGTDEYWVQASIPVGQLRWICIPQREGDEGSTVLVRQYLGAGATNEWTGRVDRLLGDLEPEGRMARLLISVPDPLGLHAEDGAAPLLIGSYVHLEVTGRDLPDVVTIDREELRDGDTVWLMDADDQLEIRPVQIAFRGRDHVLLDGGLTGGERLVVTDLPAPVAGMPLRLKEEQPSATQAAGDDEGAAP